MGPVRERAAAAVGKVLGARVAARATRRARGARQRAGAEVRDGPVLERGREEGRGSLGLGRKGEGEEIFFFFYFSNLFV